MCLCLIVAVKHSAAMIPIYASNGRPLPCPCNNEQQKELFVPERHAQAKDMCCTSYLVASIEQSEVLLTDGPKRFVLIDAVT